VAIAVNGALFAALHDAGHVAVFTLGCGLAWLRLRSGGLLAPIVFHIVHNGLTLTALSQLG
jgi:membrane protease YdiL (CAAX protease family)